MKFFGIITIILVLTLQISTNRNDIHSNIRESSVKHKNSALKNTSAKHQKSKESKNINTTKKKYKFKKSRKNQIPITTRPKKISIFPNYFETKVVTKIIGFYASARNSANKEKQFKGNRKAASNYYCPYGYEVFWDPITQLAQSTNFKRSLAWGVFLCVKRVRLSELGKNDKAINHIFIRNGDQKCDKGDTEVKINLNKYTNVGSMEFVYLLFN